VINLFHRIQAEDCHPVIEIDPSNLPNLLYLQIAHTPLSPNQQLLTFPVLKSLTLKGYCSNIQFIAAPKLRNLVILNTYGWEPEKVLSSLRQGTIRPISLSTDFISDICLAELLGIWSNLSELHLRGGYSACIPGPITTAALAGDDVTAPLCSSLRYLTVSMDRHWRWNPEAGNQCIRRLKEVVTKRKDHGVVSLQRVMGIWDCEYSSRSTEVEWVDIV
jgi:hypothetical protein